MADNKKHHYVPRFYLKRFSSDGRSVSLWNFKNEQLISAANLKHQCYKNYFYGKQPNVEKALGSVEGQVARILRNIDEFLVPQKDGTEDYLTLEIYLMMQYGRTTYSADALDEMNDRLIKNLLGPKVKAEGVDLSKASIGIKNAAQYSLGLATQIYPLILDLKCKLLINETDVEFITSDNPVVLYNQLMSFRGFGSNTGFASKGLQIFLPISSKLLLLYYDFETYSVGNRSENFVNISSCKDIHELNTLQAVSAYENVYFKNKEFKIWPLLRKANAFRRANKSIMRVFHGEETPETRKELVSTSKEDIRTNLNLSFIGVTKSTKEWRKKFQKQKSQPVAVVRNQQLCDDHKEFRKKVREGEYSYSDFFKFLSMKYDLS